MGQTEADCYGYLYRNDQEVFLESLAEDVSNNMQVKPVDPSKLKVLSESEYLLVCSGKEA